jgi:hypothetical protein
LQEILQTETDTSLEHHEVIDSAHAVQSPQYETISWRPSSAVYTELTKSKLGIALEPEQDEDFWDMNGALILTMFNSSNLTL